MYSVEYPGEKNAFVLIEKKAKRTLKEIVRHLLYWLKRKPYKIRINGDVAELCSIKHDSGNEFFYGYYDKNPERKGKILFHEMYNDHVKIIVKSLSDNKEIEVGCSKAYNWQMGARALWITDDIISYNDFEDENYVSKWYSLSKGEIVMTIPLPTMDIANNKYILAPNFHKLQIIDPCYAYNNFPIPSDAQILDYNHDGIWLYELESKKDCLLISISDILNCSKESIHEGGYHGLNHIMVSPDGKGFIFIHRARCGCERYDRLMYYEFEKSNLNCLLDGKLQSHFCWIDNHTVFGYGESNHIVGFYKIDILSKKLEFCNDLTEIHPRDGHPTVHGEWIVIDSYPDYSRLQSLIAYNYRTKTIIKLGEFFHDMKHAVYTRCDLHPRFNMKGDKIYFDTLYSGKRQLCSIKVRL